MTESKGEGRSLSCDVEESDTESHIDQEQQQQSKPGRKKNPNSQAARRDQNRIAQREFRLRKQQRIRDLEARVELLSGSQDEALDDMRVILKDLMIENQTLRNLLKSVSGFIAEGFGGILPKIGWDLAEFNTFVNKSETDTAWESFQRRKHSHGTTQTTNAMSTVLGPQSQSQKRSADDDATGRAKRPRGEASADPKDSAPAAGSTSTDRPQDKYSLLLNPSVPPVPPPSTPLYPTSRSPHEPHVFSDLMRNNSGSPMFIQPSPPASNPQYNSQQGVGVSGYPGYMGPLSMNVEMPFQNGGQRMTPASHEASDAEDNSNKGEALKLIVYHLDNFKRNSTYCLPSSLRPTLVQRTVPHESVIDRILHPELRDRMILLRGQFSLIDCLHEYKSCVTIHGDDVLAHTNWEIGETWLRKYGYLVDDATLAIVNRWRRSRGEPELRSSELASPEQQQATST